MVASLTGSVGLFTISGSADEPVRAYVPRPLPPDPALDLSRLIGSMARAEQALGRLDGMASILPSPELFVYMYVRKEALLSSQIEGTQSSLSDLLMLETDEEPTGRLDEVEEVSSYVAAMEHGLRRLSEGFPLSLRLIREMHGILLSDGRGKDKQPGEFRTSQNWIGGSRPGNALFVPPPPDRLMECLDPLEKFLHDQQTFPILLRAALVHVQFETIHPFLDGNGRIGRLLITLLLCEEGALKRPILYLSLFLKTHRSRYYELLQLVREKGDWETWLEFFFDGVATTAQQGVETAHQLLSLFKQDQSRISSIGRGANSAARVHAELQRSPILSVPALAKRLGISQPTVQKSIDALHRLDIVHESTGRRWGRLYMYWKYIEILEQGTEPLSM